MSVKVQVTVSSDERLIVAVAVAKDTVVLLFGSTQVRLDSAQPEGMLSSDAVHVPGGTLNV